MKRQFVYTNNMDLPMHKQYAATDLSSYHTPSRPVQLHQGRSHGENSTTFHLQDQQISSSTKLYSSLEADPQKKRAIDAAKSQALS